MSSLIEEGVRRMKECCAIGIGNETVIEIHQSQKCSQFPICVQKRKLLYYANLLRQGMNTSSAVKVITEDIQLWNVNEQVVVF